MDHNHYFIANISYEGLSYLVFVSTRTELDAQAVNTPMTRTSAMSPSLVFLCMDFGCSQIMDVGFASIIWKGLALQKRKADVPLIRRVDDQSIPHKCGCCIRRITRRIGALSK